MSYCCLWEGCLPTHIETAHKLEKAATGHDLVQGEGDQLSMLQILPAEGVYNNQTLSVPAGIGAVRSVFGKK